MGLLGSLFGGEKEHPALDPSSPVTPRLERNREMLEGFAQRVRDKLEIVPAERGIYVFVGKPPKAFGIVWFHDGVESNLKKLMQEKGLTAAQVQDISDALRDAYSRSADEPRYSYELAARTVLVTPSPTLQQDVSQIIRAVSG
jgi:hypothetical protein